jgi:iron complex transport system ATP-binding protein
MTLAARALEFGFPGRAVGRVDELSLQAGEVVCLLGPNGGGKTTLLRTLLGLVAPRAGEVTLDQRPLPQWSARARATRLAYVPQAAESFFDFTLREMVEMGRVAHRGLFARPSALDRATADGALRRVGLASLAERPIHRVSGGERQLAYIARALATQAPFLLMDEPGANLDIANQALILEEIARLRATGVGVLFSTHVPDHALQVADRVVLLGGGKVIAAGPAAGALTSQSLSALYGRAMEVVELPCGGGPARRVCVACAPARFP